MAAAKVQAMQRGRLGRRRATEVSEEEAGLHGPRGTR
eukprot:COSAG01_NODE_4942_length_4606_cov_6.417573_3_plen_37_part_00